MSEPIATIARSSAERLSAELGHSLAVDVETVLRARDSAQRPEQYFDPVSLGSLIVGIATLAWTVYTDLRSKIPKPSPEVTARTIRAELRDSIGADTVAREHMIEIIVSETLRTAESHDDAARSSDRRPKGSSG